MSAAHERGPVSATWRGEAEPAPARPGAAGLARAALRGVPLVLLLGAGLLLALLARPVEAALARGRPATPWIAVWVCRGALRLMGLGVRVEGRLGPRAEAVVANHSSWLDILVLNALGPMVFVSKAEVAGWPGIGLLARATGTVFVRREARGEAAAQAGALAARLAAGERLLLFPEGTSTDNRRVLPFKPALFEALRGAGAVRPVTVAYEAPMGEDPRALCWWGGMAFGPHALAVLAARRPGRARVVVHPAIPTGGRDRKALAAAAEAAVRAGLSPAPRRAP